MPGGKPQLPLNTEIIPVASSHIYLHLIEIYGCIHLLGEVDVNQNKCQIQLENITWIRFQKL